MKASTGRWVSGDDFFNRDGELRILETLVQDRNHVLLTGQRRMGKTSIVRELGRRLEAAGWIFLFADVEGATSAEDAISEIARAAHPVRSIGSRFAVVMKHFFSENFEEITAVEFGVKIRAGRIADVLEVLEHDGYLESNDDGHTFASRLLKDWWTARFRDHHVPIRSRESNEDSREGML